MAIDYTTDVGKIRLMITDTDESDFIFTDDQINAFLSIEDDVLECGAALALETIASQQVLTDKYLSIGDISLNGVAPAENLMKRAAGLRRGVGASSVSSVQIVDASDPYNIRI
jgi:hypothetical protein